MLSLAGSLSTFSANIHPRDFPLYDHDNLGDCFTELDEKLRLLLETVVPATSFRCPSNWYSPPSTPPPSTMTSTC